jgi:hypothetical protein
MSRLLLAIPLAAALIAAGCNSTVIIYDYSSQGGGKLPSDTVYVEKPGISTPVPPGGGSEPVPPGGGGSEPVPPGGGTTPVPPDTSGQGHEIEHPGRWSSIQPLYPGTARLETVVSQIDGLIIYRVIGNTINGRSRAVDLNPEVWKHTDSDQRERYLDVAFDSRLTWLETLSTGEVFRINAGGDQVAAWTLDDAVEVLPEPLENGMYRVTIRFPATLELLRILATTEDVTTVLTEGTARLQGVFSADNTLNFNTFYEVYVVGDGTKTSIPEGLLPGAPAVTEDWSVLRN